MNNVTYVIDTSDSRMFYLLKSLTEQGYNAISLGAWEHKSPACYVYSPAKRLGQDELLALADNSTLLCGSMPQSGLLILESKGIVYINLLLDELFAIENAIQTAEAALMLIIRATNTSIFKQRILIFGFGRLGRALTRIFSGLRLDFAICTNDYYERAAAHISCKDVYDINTSLEGVDVIVNTIPAKIFASDRLSKATKCCYILDLASFSSLDNIDADTIGIPYDNALGLPGKYSPKSAAEILASAVINATSGLV